MKQEPELAMAKLMNDLPYLMKYMEAVAKLHRLKFDALKAEGFTDAQALELCKEIIK